MYTITVTQKDGQVVYYIVTDEVNGWKTSRYLEDNNKLDKSTMEAAVTRLKETFPYLITEVNEVENDTEY